MVYSARQERYRTQPVRWWHEAIVDDMLQYPRSLLKDRAARLKFSAGYLSLIMNTDAFKALYEQRRAAFTARLETSILNKTNAAADKALDLVIEVLDKKRDKIPFAELAEFTDRTLERLGYGVQKPGGVNVHINNGNVVQPQITREQLAEARRDLRAVEDQRQKVIDLKPNQPPSEPSSPPASDVKDLA